MRHFGVGGLLSWVFGTVIETNQYCDVMVNVWKGGLDDRVRCARVVGMNRVGAVEFHLRVVMIVIIPFYRWGKG